MTKIRVKRGKRALDDSTSMVQAATVKDQVTESLIKESVRLPPDKMPHDNHR